MKVEVKSGDISRFEADALITAINSGGMWFGGIDGVIQRSCGGNFFHDQVRAVLPQIKHGDAVLAYGLGLLRKDTFKNVVFVVDDLQGPLHQIIYIGLAAAAKAYFTSVSLPTIRMGVMLGAVEKSIEEATGEMAKGVKQFIADNPNSSIEQITFVVYKDATTQAQLEKDLLG